MKLGKGKSGFLREGCESSVLREGSGKGYHKGKGTERAEGRRQQQWEGGDNRSVMRERGGLRGEGSERRKKVSPCSLFFLL